MKSGVYKIEHIESGKKYIGSAKNIYYRIRDHVFKLKRGTNSSAHLQNAWNKYGAKAFKFSPLLICRSEDRIFYEQLCLDAYLSYERDLGYNVRKIAESNEGNPPNENQKNALRKIWLNPEYRKKRRCPEPGEKYGRLTLIELREKTAGSYTWLCQCDCGKKCLKQVGCLRRGDTRSCGCFNSEESSKRRKALLRNSARL